MSVHEWPDEQINRWLGHQPDESHFHQVVFGDSGAAINLKPMEKPRKPGKEDE